MYILSRRISSCYLCYDCWIVSDTNKQANKLVKGVDRRDIPSHRRRICQYLDLDVDALFDTLQNTLSMRPLFLMDRISATCLQFLFYDGTLACIILEDVSTSRLNFLFNTFINTYQLIIQYLPPVSKSPILNSLGFAKTLRYLVQILISIQLLQDLFHVFVYFFVRPFVYSFVLPIKTDSSYIAIVCCARMIYTLIENTTYQITQFSLSHNSHPSWSMSIQIEF